MKIEKLLESDKSEFTKGEPLSKEYPYSTVIVYRAQPATDRNLPTNSYVTRSLRFAKDHAVHMANTEGEPQHVIKCLVKTANIFNAGNPGEYIYDGVPVAGKVIFTANEGDDFE